MRKTIKELPELKDLSEEELHEIRSDFYIPNFGRFFIDTKKVKIKRKLNKLK